MRDSFGTRFRFLRDSDRLEGALRDPRGDRFEEVASAWVAKELLRDVYAAGGISEARQLLSDFDVWCEEVEIAEVSRLARTFRGWEEDVVNFHRTGLTNGMTEAQNLLIEKISRVGHGFRSFEHYRLRLLLHCGVKLRDYPNRQSQRPSSRLVA